MCGMAQPLWSACSALIPPVSFLPQFLNLSVREKQFLSTRNINHSIHIKTHKCQTHGEGERLRKCIESDVSVCTRRWRGKKLEGQIYYNPKHQITTSEDSGEGWKSRHFRPLAGTAYRTPWQPYGKKHVMHHREHKCQLRRRPLNI